MKIERETKKINFKVHDYFIVIHTLVYIIFVQVCMFVFNRKQQARSSFWFP